MHRSKTLQEFCRVVRQERGNRCERCGITYEKIQVEAHHVLDVQTYPQFAEDRGNIVILCQRCHAKTQNRTLNDRELIDFYARLPDKVIERLVRFLDNKHVKLSLFAAQVTWLTQNTGDAGEVFLKPRRTTYLPRRRKSQPVVSKATHDAVRRMEALQGRYATDKLKYHSLKGYMR